jgi:hypothetical protein
LDYYEDDQPLPSTTESIEIARFINNLASIARSPYTDGFSQCTCKHELFLLKCLIEDLYKDLPDFPQQEKEWEQKRLMEILKNE